MIDDEKKKVEFFDELTKEYFSRGFGNMPKRDIDILIYYLLEKHGVFEGKSIYELARKLRTTPTKIKTAKYDAVLRFDHQNLDDPEYLRKSLKEYFKKPVLELESSHLKIQIQDRALLDGLKGELTKGGLFFDGSFSGDVLKVDAEKYAIFLSTLVFEKDEKNDLKEARDAYNKLKASGFEKFGNWVFKKAVDEGGSKGLNFISKLTYNLLTGDYADVLPYLHQLP